MRYYFILAAAASSLALSACDADEPDTTPIDDTDAIVVEEDEGYPVAGELSQDQRARFDELDRDAAAQEYDDHQRALASSEEQAADSSSDASAASGSANTDQQSESDSASSGTDDAAVAPLRPRSAMDFAFLDRNDDGQLSVAEYAIWAVRSNPRRPKPNDETRPYTSPDQINEAGETFFYFDADGDTYLSPSEFSAARSSTRTP